MNSWLHKGWQNGGKIKSDSDIYLILWEPLSGIEPETFALREQRSTN